MPDRTPWFGDAPATERAQREPIKYQADFVTEWGYMQWLKQWHDTEDTA